MKTEPSLFDALKHTLSSQGITSMFPHARDRFHPNLQTKVQVGLALAEELSRLGEADTARKVIRDVTLHVLSESGKYRSSLSWLVYQRRYRHSPECCCDWQSRIAYLAKALGFDDLSKWVVSLQCPASPPDYRRNAPVEAHLDESRYEQNALIVSRFLAQGIDFMSAEKIRE